MTDRDLKQEKTDALLKLALEEQMEQDDYLNQYPSDDELENPHIFSDEHNRKMKKIIKMALRVERRGERSKQYRRIAAVIGLVLIGSVTMVTQVEAFRVPMMRFFQKVTEKSTLFGVQKENNFSVTEKFQEYEPQYIPAGFSVAEVSETKYSFYITYVNDNASQKYTFLFYNGRDTTAIDSENASTWEDSIDGNKVTVIQKGDEIRLLMTKAGNDYCLQGNVALEEGYKILESIK